MANPAASELDFTAGDIILIAIKAKVGTKIAYEVG
jgi:hypothetical protein